MVVADDNKNSAGNVIQFGTMHEAIGQQQHQGRVRFSDLLKHPHFYGVAALEGLHGEATIFDGNITVTTVDDQGQLLPVKFAASAKQATLLVGAYVDMWTERPLPDDIAAERFDQFVADMAAKADVIVEKPFVFTIEGDVMDVRLHVINGACPIHARLKKVEIPKAQQPFEAELKKIKGTIVGVYAKDAVGRLTHPATSTHVHLLFVDPASGEKVTGHVEQIGVRKGAVLRLPKSQS
jgi:alpha-acetolactate decarboxylase